MADLSGQTFDGFEILCKLGQGGMGAVYKARQVSLNRFVALKVMSNALAEDQEFIERFKREATTAAQFKHPNIVQVHAAGESNGTYYMAMEFVEGRTVREHIRSRGRLDPQEAIAITLHVAEALKYAWNKSRMIHRDIKPDNVFLSQSGEVLVGDLGLAKSLGSSSTEMTSTGMMLGSPHYISPEQAMSAKDIDFRADIYSLGCTLFQMLTGRTAYQGDSSMALMMKHVHDPPPDIFEAIPECPRKLGVMVGRMMAKNRDDRPSSYDELIAGLWEANENLSGDTEIGRPPAAPALPPTAVGCAAAVPTVASTPRKQLSPGLIYGVAGGVVVLLLAGLMIWSPWKASSTGNVSPDTSVTDDAGWKNAINLLPLIDLQEDAASGQWKLENGALFGAKGVACLELPYRPPDEYDFRIVFTPRGPGVNGCQHIAIAGKQFVWNFGAGKGRLFGFEEVDGQTVQASPLSVVGEPMRPGKRYTSLVEVRHGRVRSYLDGRLLVELNPEQVALNAGDHWRLRDGSRLGVGTQNQCTYHAIEVREVTGKGTFTRGAPSGTSITPSLQHSASSSAAALQLLGNVFTNSVGAEMVYIPPGEFLLGSTKEEQDWAAANGAAKKGVTFEGETPRKATIKQGFWMGRTEVTIGQWKQFVKETGYVTDGEKQGESYVQAEGKPWAPKRGVNWRNPDLGFEPRDNHPVSCISWNDAVPFCEWLTEHERKAGRMPAGMVVRLPGEAEWEYACRAGTQTKFWWGDSKEDGKERLNWAGKEDGYEFVAPVDSFGERGRNRFGLTDMLGNVWEWCLDEFDATQAHEDVWRGNRNTRVLRGAEFKYIPALSRCAYRINRNPPLSDCAIGFRVVVGVDVTGGSKAATAPLPAAPREGEILAPPETRVTALTTTPKAGEVFTLNVGSNVTMELMGIPPGEFMLGSTKEEQAWSAANGAKEEVKREGEAPRKASIKQGFWLGRTEVTVGQWKEFVAATGYKTIAEKNGYVDFAFLKEAKRGRVNGLSWRDPGFGFTLRDDHPVCCVSWNDAVVFCEWLTEREQKAGRLLAGHLIRLPTEAEWEYACRAGSQTRFWWSDSEEDAKDRLNWSGKEDGFEFAAPVDNYGARGRNRFGLADMLGNVLEWCLDEPDVKQAHEECYRGFPDGRVFRGGAFRDKPAYVRCAFRKWSRLSSSGNDLGFRVCYGVDVSAAKTTASTSPAAAPKEGGILAPPETRVTALTTNPKVGEVYTLNVGSNVTMELMGIPPGEFLMGSTKEEQAWAVANGLNKDWAVREGESPHKEAIKQGFWMGRTEVTVNQWKQFVNATGYVTDGEKRGESFSPLKMGKALGSVKGMSWREPKFFSLEDNQPVTCISRNDAMAFCKWLTDRELKAGHLPPGFVLRLPADAEWEYACRAGTQCKFWWGENPENGKGRLNWHEDGGKFGWVFPVDTFGLRGRNGFGLADMLGNVYEWCLGEYDAKQAHDDLMIKLSKRTAITRGGSFHNVPANCRSAYRYVTKSDESDNWNGFRVCVGVER
ncbi:MAG: SUMF1/EgtB/PvdO family nonheme iron enzyme [Verrucomicrobia bacterium]|nr:SUMF1/EgtB/PvdO family nonheme iron enzyme [Verrucomicrobiota bacterium]